MMEKDVANEAKDAQDLGLSIKIMFSKESSVESAVSQGP
jgi:hypothetical protein